MKTGFLWNATCPKEIWSIFWDPYIRNTDVVDCEYCVSDLGGRSADDVNGVKGCRRLGSVRFRRNW